MARSFCRLVAQNLDSGTLNAMTDFDHAPELAAQWDARYASKEQVWSGNVNRLLVRELDGGGVALEPGTALDVGSGEGADSVWLAKLGWDVTGVDISAIAVQRASEFAEREGVHVDFRAEDISTTSGQFDLVSAFFPSVPSESDMLAQILSLVAPGGTLLYVHHVHPDSENASGYRAHRPGYLSPFDVREVLDAQPGYWRIDKLEIVKNDGPSDSDTHSHDNQPSDRHDEHGHRHPGLGKFHQFDAVLRATRT